jgi:hypothetical protein
MNVNQLFGFFNNKIESGWNTLNAQLTYASATTISSSMNLTNTIPRCAKFRWKQGGNYKYAYVVNITSTTLTILAGSDYSVANTTITDAAWSVSDPAIGFPSKFNYVPTIVSGFGSITSLGTCVTKFFIINSNLHFNEVINIVTNGTGTNHIKSTIPMPMGGPDDIPIFGRENAINGKPLMGRAEVTSNNLLVWNFDMVYPGIDGAQLIIQGNYPI